MLEALIQKTPTITDYDKSKLYKDKIEPAVQQVIALCSAYDIPMFFAACVKNENGESKYQKEVVSPASHDIKLEQDYFPNLLAVTLGFTTVPPVERVNIEFDVNDDNNDAEG